MNSDLQQESVIYQVGGYNLREMVMIKTFHEVLTLYIKEGNQESKPKTRIRDEACVLILKQFFRGWKVGNVSGKQIINGRKITEYREWRKAQGVSVSTIARELSVASCAITYCVRDLDWDLNNPFEKRQYSKADRKKVKSGSRDITTEEEKALLAHPIKVFRDLMEFYLETAMRTSEPLNLTRDRILDDMAYMGADDHKGGYVDCRYLSERAREILNDQPDHPIYCFTLNGEKVSYWWLRNQMWKLRKDIGSPDLKFKYLRKTAGNRMRKLLGLEAAQALLGHVDKRTTERNYTPSSADLLRSALLTNSEVLCEEALSTKGKPMVPERGIEPPTYALRMLRH